jgi:MFS family permease
MSGQIIGQLFGQAAGGVIGDAFGWRTVFFVLAGLFAVAALGLAHAAVAVDNKIIRVRRAPDWCHNLRLQSSEWPEMVCAENPDEYFHGTTRRCAGGQAGFLKIVAG